ncbi:unnamed protein product [Linum trigynum]|uniref:RNase H type-1 domain-containing protein n=1 Tax=Linum trigynum TaxID=586398 RepID=A0AAV2DMN2_9ROSI
MLDQFLCWPEFETRKISHHGQVYDGKVESFLCSNPIQAEAYAILNAVVLAAQEPCPASIKSDCQVLVNALRQDPDSWPWQCRAILVRVTPILLSTPCMTVEFVPRCLNALADWVVRNARLNLLPRE